MFFPTFLGVIFFLSVLRRQAERCRNRRRSRILMSMLVVFFFSWLPLNTINLAEDLGMSPEAGVLVRKLCQLTPLS